MFSSLTTVTSSSSPQYDVRTWRFGSTPPATPSWWSLCVRVRTWSWRVTSWATAAACSPNSSSSCPRTDSRTRPRWVRRATEAWTGHLCLITQTILLEVISIFCFSYISHHTLDFTGARYRFSDFWWTASSSLMILDFVFIRSEI